MEVSRPVAKAAFNSAKVRLPTYIEMGVFALICPEVCTDLGFDKCSQAIYTHLKDQGRDWDIGVATLSLCQQFGRVLAGQFGVSEHPSSAISQTKTENSAKYIRNRMQKNKENRKQGEILVVSKDVMQVFTSGDEIMACFDYIDAPIVTFALKITDFVSENRGKTAIIKQEDSESLGNALLSQSCMQTNPWSAVYVHQPTLLSHCLSSILGIPTVETPQLRSFSPRSESKSDYNNRIKTYFSGFQGNEIVLLDEDMYKSVTETESSMVIWSENRVSEVIEMNKVVLVSPTAGISKEVLVDVACKELGTGGVWTVEREDCVELAEALAERMNRRCERMEIGELCEDTKTTETTECEGREQWKLILVPYQEQRVVCVPPELMSSLTGSPLFLATFHFSPASDWTFTHQIPPSDVKSTYFASHVVSHLQSLLPTLSLSSNTLKFSIQLEKTIAQDLKTLFVSLENTYNSAIHTANLQLQTTVDLWKAEIDRKNKELLTNLNTIRQNLEDLLGVMSENSRFYRESNVEKRLKDLENTQEALFSQFKRFYDLLPASNFPVKIQTITENWELSTENIELFTIEEADLWAESESSGNIKLIDRQRLSPGISTVDISRLHSHFSENCSVSLVWRQERKEISEVLAVKIDYLGSKT